MSKKYRVDELQQNILNQEIVFLYFVFIVAFLLTKYYLYYLTQMQTDNIPLKVDKEN